MAQLPAMLPAFFAAARMAVPAAVLAATVVEWLATGQGVGSLMALSASLSNYGMLWSAMRRVSLVACLFYAVVGTVRARGAGGLRVGAALREPRGLRHPGRHRDPDRRLHLRAPALEGSAPAATMCATRIPAGFPDPTMDEMDEALRLLADAATGTPIILDGFVSGAMEPQALARLARPPLRHRSTIR